MYVINVVYVVKNHQCLKNILGHIPMTDRTLATIVILGEFIWTVFHDY